ncbi:cupin domain-containing protein [Acuticoccus mangrovi]|uniref:Cupin domain-containing protein n=1 Tax=Acuticoccus mangrovi TaxID=2796142 RepID=A0A934IMB0_9HYPH|nr:cupin domain-containing protein [Acuticoccus mangrovi]MBJ3774983.1 cupin domain-containing protein [Acuticoccus mangrovi]
MSATEGGAIPTLQVDEDHVRVTEWRFPPGTATGYHRHEYPYVVVPTVPGTLTMVDAAGKEAQSTLQLGVSYSRHCGVEHDVQNRTDGEIVFVEIELKKA